MRGWAVLLLLLCACLSGWAADYELFRENGKTGLRDQSGKVILPASFDALGWTDGSFSVINQVTGYRQNSKWGLINLNKQIVTKAEYESVTSSGADRVIVSKWINPFTKKFGCVDLEGKVTVPFLYDGISIRGLRAIVFIKNGVRYEYGLIDLNDKSILPLHFREIKPVGTLRLAVQNFQRKTALFSEEGFQLTEFTIDSISTFKKGKAIVYQDFNQGVINRDGNFEKEPIYREVRINDPGETETRGFDEWKILNERNQEQATSNLDSLTPMDYEYRASLAGKHGLAGADLKIRLPLQFDYLGPIENNLMAVRRENKWGVLNTSGKEVLALEFDSLRYERNFIMAAKKSMGALAWSVYDTFGVRKTEKKYESISTFNGKFFPVRNYGFQGGVDRYGKEILSCVYDSLLEHNYSLVGVKFKGQYGLIDYTEKWIILPQPRKIQLVNENLFLEFHDSITFLKALNGETIYFTQNKITPQKDYLDELLPDGGRKKISFEGMDVSTHSTSLNELTEQIFEESEGYRGIQRDGRFGFIDSRGRLRVANRYEGIGKFKYGLAPVKILGKWGFVNAEDKIIINPSYEQVEEFTDGISISKRNGKWGVIDLAGKVLFEFRYDSIISSADKLILIQNKKRGLADKKGNVLIEPRFDQLQPLSNAHVLVCSDGQWGVLTNDGLNVIPMIYDGLLYNETTHHYLAHKKSPWVKASAGQ
jgi:WG containing repeat